MVSYIISFVSVSKYHKLSEQVFEYQFNESEDKEMQLEMESVKQQNTELKIGVASFVCRAQIR